MSLAAQRRQNSIAHAYPKQASKRPPQPNSTHAADPFLHKFLDPSLDPADYLNAVLPPLQTQATSSSGLSTTPGAVPLSELSSTTQATLSQLNAHATRLTATLTQLTDEILRSGSRLAYEVELLRGKTISLTETLTDGLRDDIAKFAPDGVLNGLDAKTRSGTRRDSASVAGTPVTPSPAIGEGAHTTAPGTSAEPVSLPNEPASITQLRTLTLVRSRLESVIQTFDAAMKLFFPPSELSISSSFLSVSAPDAGGENYNTETKGQQVIKQLRDEIAELLNNEADPLKGIEDAAGRVEELKKLCLVWKGTVEEKGRKRFVDSLAKMVEDRHMELVRETEQTTKKESAKAQEMAASGSQSLDGDSAAETRGYGAYGLISQLQKLRSGI